MGMIDSQTDESVLDDATRQRYEADGYLSLENFLSRDWIERLQAASQEFVERSRSIEASTSVLDVEPGHTPENPRLRRLMGPVDEHETFREFALEGPAAEIAVALLGRPARFHHSKLNFKWAGGGEEIKWHQDIQFWPHSDFSPLTIGVYLDDVDDEMGPMGIVPGSHRGECFDLYDNDDNWTGALKDEDVARVPLDTMRYLKGPAGSVTVHNAVCVHGSLPNNSNRPRPLLLQTYSAATSYPLLGVGVNGRTGRASGTLVGARAPRWMTIGGRDLPVAPDWSGGGYTTIFDVQQDDS